MTGFEFLGVFLCGHIPGTKSATGDPYWCQNGWTLLYIFCRGNIKVIFTYSFHLLMWLFRNRICSKCEKVCYLASFSLCQRFLYVQNLNLFPFSSYFVGYYWDNPTLIVPIYKGKTMYNDKMRDGMMPTIHFWIHWEWNETG